MEMDYYDWGGFVNSNINQFDLAVQKVYQACLDNPSCEVIELRVNTELGRESIVVEFADGTFEIDNSAGIHRVERLALSFCATDKFCWDIRTLRKNFPVTLHQNHVLEDEPRSLCLYIEPWESVERSWTPQLFIKRIFWWLRATAEGNIHGDDQPIEHLFFSSPYNVLLPENHFLSEDNANRKLSFTCIDYEGVRTKTLVGNYRDGNSKSDAPLYVSISLLLHSVENGPIEEYPHTLGQLQDTLEQRGSSILDSLKSTVQGLAPQNGIEFKRDNKEFVLLLLGIPRSRNGNVEQFNAQGFIIDSEISLLGEKLSVLVKPPGENKWYKDTAFGAVQSDDWKSLQIFPVNVKCYPTNKEIRQYSGLNPDDEGLKGIIAGVGTLGGLVAKIWKRECWGDWSLVDDDIIQAHNIARHISSHDGLGFPKSAVVASIVNNIHPVNVENTSQFFVSNVLSEDQDLMDS